MRRARRLLAVLGAVGILLVVAIFTAVIAVLLWLPNEQQLARDVELELESALGVKVIVAALRWQLLPLPAIMLTDVATEQTPPVSFKKLTLYPKLSALYKRSLLFDLAELDGAVVPQLSLRKLGLGPGGESLPGGLALAAIPLERFVFRNVTWITRRGIPVVYDGEVDFDERWRPRTAQLRRPDYKPLTEAGLARVGQQDQWRVNIRLGGGTLNGDLQLKTTPNGWLRFDMGKAVRSAGKDHTGQTALDGITGAMNTQNTPQGIVVNFKNIKARSGALSASGDATLANRRIEAEFAVDLVDGIIGVPLVITGPTDKVVVSVPAGAVAGAVVGTAVLPVVGTGIGARVGAAIGKLFGASLALPASSPRRARP